MRLHELKPAEGSRHRRKRVGRGMVLAWAKRPVVVIRARGSAPGAEKATTLKVVRLL